MVSGVDSGAWHTVEAVLDYIRDFRVVLHRPPVQREETRLPSFYKFGQ